jgi:predicted AAA+ superfamily ATPase
MHVMEKFFNNAGPQQPHNNYTLDPLRRIKLEELQGLIDQERYFILHAPRQTGKTTALYALMHHYNAGTQYRALYVNIEAGHAR